MPAPALWIACPLIAGVVAGVSLDCQPPFTLIAVVLGWVTTAVAWRRGRGTLFVLSIAAESFAIGAALGGHAGRASTSVSLLDWYDRSSHDDPVHLTGVLRSDAARTASGATVIVDATAVDGHAVDGGVRVSIAGGLAAGAADSWRGGRTVAMDALLREPLDYRDPGVPSDRLRLARQGIVLLGSVKSAAMVTVVARGTPISESAAALRAWVRTATSAAVGRWSRKSAGVVTAILIGDRTGLDVEDERRLQEAGTYHVIAISGGNIALLTALLVALGRAVRLPARGTAAASIAILAFYGYAAGLAPSVLRATLAGMIYLAARVLDQRGTALNALAVAAAFAAVASPPTVLDAGFVLSFGATVAIVIAASRLAPVSARDRRAGRAKALAMGVAAAARALGAATLCAEIALAPVGAALFGRVSLAGLLLNFVAIPLMSVIQVAGLAAVAAVALSPGIGSTCGWIAHIATAALLWSARLVDVAPWLVLDLPPPAMWVTALWYAGWAGLLVLRRPRYRRAAIAAAGLAGLLLVSGPRIARGTLVPASPPGWTRVVMLDVGQGDATLVQLSDGRALLVDTGGVASPGFDLGRRVTLPASWAFGVRRLSALVLTHGDPDHIGGAPAIVRGLTPAEIWEGIPVPRHEPLRRLHDLAGRAGIPWVEKRAGQSMTAGSATIAVLNPPDPDWERQKVRNDDSIVLELRIGDVAFVLPGDITSAVEPGVAARFEPAPIVIVKAPHHGSAGSSSPAFVDAMHPSVVLFSAGRRNPFGHPAPAVVARYRSAGARVFNTAEDGAVVIDTNGRDVVAWTWNNRLELLHAPTAASQRRHEDRKAQSQ
jgi:competence protein ComEC